MVARCTFRVILLCLHLILFATTATLSSACNHNSQTPKYAQESHDQSNDLSLKDIPGTYLVYTVNDPRTSSVNIRRTAHVIMAELTLLELRSQVQRKGRMLQRRR